MPPRRQYHDRTSRSRAADEASTSCNSSKLHNIRTELKVRKEKLTKGCDTPLSYSGRLGPVSSSQFIHTITSLMNGIVSSLLNHPLTSFPPSSSHLPPANTALHPFLAAISMFSVVLSAEVALLIRSISAKTCW